MHTAIHVEVLPASVAARWEELGLQFADIETAKQGGFMSCLHAALHLLNLSPAMGSTVAALCHSLHPLSQPAPGVDVSFSDPEVPFSVFVSCPREDEPDRAARLAEGLLHEALHLQLSLVERLCPLVGGDGEDALVHSPWKGEGRTVQGLLHAVYVFANIHRFWSEVGPESEMHTAFASARCATIQAEFRNAGHLVRCTSLTDAGLRAGRLHIQAILAEDTGTARSGT